MAGIHARAEAAHLRAAELHEEATSYWEAHAIPVPPSASASWQSESDSGSGGASPRGAQRGTGAQRASKQLTSGNTHERRDEQGDRGSRRSRAGSARSRGSASRRAEDRSG